MKNKRNKLINLFKIGVLLFGVSLLLWNCQDNNEIDNLDDISINEKLDYTIKKIRYSDLITDQEIKKSLPKIRQIFSNNITQKIQSKNTVDISESFTIITDNIHKVTTKDVITWSFRIKTPVLKSSDFENFLVKKQDKKFSYFLVSYEKDSEKEYKNAILYPIPEEYLNLSNLNLAREGGYIQCPDREDCGGGGSVPGCSGIINVIPCNNGDSYTHGPEPFTSGGNCTGTTTIIDFSHCSNGTSNPSNTSTPNNSNNNGGGSSSGGTTITNPVTLEWDWGDSEEKIINNLTEKAKCIYDKLIKSSTDFKNAIKKFDGEFPVSHLMLTINNNLGSRVYGETQPPVNYVTEIQINGGGLSNLSDLGAATTLAHEIVHAEIFRKMLSAAKRGDLNTNTMTQKEAENYVNSLKDNFPGLYDYYVERWHPAWNHNMMASHYINTIADIIQDFDDNRLSRSTYESVAWAGLGEIENNQSTVAWQNLTSSEQQMIINVLNQYFFNGTSNCN